MLGEVGHADGEQGNEEEGEGVAEGAGDAFEGGWFRLGGHWVDCMPLKIMHPTKRALLAGDGQAVEPGQRDQEKTPSVCFADTSPAGAVEEEEMGSVGDDHPLHHA